MLKAETGAARGFGKLNILPPMPVTMIRHVRDAIDLAAGMGADLGAAWWRGHTRSEWALAPKLYRAPNRAVVEHNLVLDFQSRAVSRRVGCPPTDDHPAWLFLAQHYGLPTRLLDWTQSILFALFFAVRDEGDAADGALWALNPVALNGTQTGDDRLLLPVHVRGHFDCAFTGDAMPDGKIVAVAPAEVDVRLMVQLSMFTVHPVETPIDKLADSDMFLRKYTVFGEAKEEIRATLNLLGINVATLFPDLQHLAEDIDLTWR